MKTPRAARSCCTAPTVCSSAPIGGRQAVSKGEVAEAAKRAVPSFDVSLPEGKGPGHRTQPWMDLICTQWDFG